MGEAGGAGGAKGPVHEATLCPLACRVPLHFWVWIRVKSPAKAQWEAGRGDCGVGRQHCLQRFFCTYSVPLAPCHGGEQVRCSVPGIWGCSPGWAQLQGRR